MFPSTFLDKKLAITSTLVRAYTVGIAVNLTDVSQQFDPSEQQIAILVKIVTKLA